MLRKQIRGCGRFPIGYKSEINGNRMTTALLQNP